MPSGPEMMLTAALRAFVKADTAEKVTFAIEGMLKDGTLDGIGSLVSDIAEIKRAHARIEFGLGRVFAVLQSQQQVHEGGKNDGVPGGAGIGPLYTVAPVNGPLAISDGGQSGGTGSGADTMGGGDIGDYAVSASYDRSSCKGIGREEAVE